MKKKCKKCGLAEFKLYPNKLCQRCLSLKFEESIRDKGKEIFIDSGTLINEYLVNLKSANQIAKDYGVKSHKIRKYLKNYAIPGRSSIKANTKYINENVFQKLDEESAYLLGYIFTDGDLILNKNKHTFFLRIYSKHRYLIENVKSILQAEAKVQHRGKKRWKEINQSEMFFIHIERQSIIIDLMDLGMKLDKSELKFPEIPKKLIHHFIRGLWTGSGCVSMNNFSVMSSIQLSSEGFMIELENHLNRIGLKKRTIYKSKNSKKPSYLIKYALSESEKLYNYLYRGNTNLTTCRRQEKLYKEHFEKFQSKLF
ncbi:MAG: LAGLIDADG family homing endonuclease [Algibacter sp.]